MPKTTKPKTPKGPPDQLTLVVSENVKALLKYRFPGMSVLAVSKLPKSKMSQPQLSRAVHAAHAQTTDTLDKLARTFGVPAYSLLVPNLNPADLPELTTRSLIEARVNERVEKRWTRVRAQLGAQLNALYVNLDEEAEQRPSISDPYPTSAVAGAGKKGGAITGRRPAAETAAGRQQARRHK